MDVSGIIIPTPINKSPFEKVYYDILKAGQIEEHIPQIYFQQNSITRGVPGIKIYKSCNVSELPRKTPSGKLAIPVKMINVTPKKQTFYRFWSPRGVHTMWDGEVTTIYTWHCRQRSGQTPVELSLTNFGIVWEYIDFMIEHMRANAEKYTQMYRANGGVPLGEVVDHHLQS
jgi:hypothetical protein